MYILHIFLISVYCLLPPIFCETEPGFYDYDYEPKVSKTKTEKIYYDPEYEFGDYIVYEFTKKYADLNSSKYIAPLTNIICVHM